MLKLARTGAGPVKPFRTSQFSLRKSAPKSQRNLALCSKGPESCAKFPLGRLTLAPINPEEPDRRESSLMGIWNVDCRTRDRKAGSSNLSVRRFHMSWRSDGALRSTKEIQVDVGRELRSTSRERVAWTAAGNLHRQIRGKESNTTGNNQRAGPCRRPYSWSPVCREGHEAGGL